MGTIRTRTKSIGTSPEPGAGTGFLFFRGAGKLEGLILNYGASADANTVVTAYDGFDTNGTSIYTRTSGTDAGTTVPVRIAGDARIVAGTSTAGVASGLVFSRGLYIDVTADVAGPQVITAFIRPLVRKSGSITTTGSAGSASGEKTIISGPGLLHGFRTTYDQNAPTTTDLTFHNGLTSSAATILTVGNTATSQVAQVATTTGHDEAGSDVTTAATGSYGNNGILFSTGVTVAVAQCDALSSAVDIDLLVEL